MKASDMFGGQYLSTNDLDGSPLTGTISAITSEVLEGRDGRDRERIILHVAGVKKPVVVNATNGTRLIESLGDETDAWIGKKISLVKGKVMYAGSRVDTIVITAV